MSLFLLLHIGICLFYCCRSSMETFDCPMRELTLQFAHHIQPHLSMVQLQEIADALNGSPEAQNCNLSAAELFSNIKHQISTFRTPHIWSDLSSARETENILKVYVSNEYGSDSDHSGLSIESPFKTIHFALHKVRELRNYSISPNAMIIIKEGVYHFDSPLILNHFDSNLLITNFNNESVTISGSIPLYNCSWTLYQHTPDGHDVYSVDLKNSLTLKLIDNVPFDGLRVNGRRAIRARFPNTDPELDGFGSTLLALEWFPSKIDAIPEIEVNPKDIPVRNDSNEFMYYQAGIGGICNVFDPPMGYWCGNMTEGGGAATYQVPSGLRYNSSILPHAPYRNTTNGIVSVWHPSHWATWHFKMGKVDDEIITFSSGGFQDARGGVKGKEFFVENVFEELDAPNEWYYDETQSLLFYVNNMTDGQQPSCGDGVFTVTNLKTLVRFEGNQSFPVRNVTIRGITFRDAAMTEFEPHTMPSGGDWTIQRIGCITIKGAERVNITDNRFVRNDGIAIILNGYNRNVTIQRNEFVWNGDTAIALVGDTTGFNFNGSRTMGYDGTTGTQPRFTRILSNFGHEVGIWQKQSAFYFQAKTCQNEIRRNIFFNGPRAGINFNDGFGGGSNVESNLVFNMCRESGDHGPFNSWDRQVFVTAVRNGTKSTQKAVDRISRNLMIGNYHSQDVIDNDDGSCYYEISRNLLVYSPNGQKSDSGGHDMVSFGNIYAFISVHPGWDWWGPTCFHDFTTQRVGHNNFYFNNTCILSNGTVIDGDKPAVRVGYAKWMQCDDGGIAFNTSDFKTWTVIHDNRIYIDGQKHFGLCNMTETEFQRVTQLDPGTVIYTKLPDDQQLLLEAKEMLW